MSRQTKKDLKTISVVSSVFIAGALLLYPAFADNTGGAAAPTPPSASGQRDVVTHEGNAPPQCCLACVELQRRVAAIEANQAKWMQWGREWQAWASRLAAKVESYHSANEPIVQESMEPPRMKRVRVCRNGVCHYEWVRE